jgi:hypothetical protein
MNNRLRILKYKPKKIWNNHDNYLKHKDRIFNKYLIKYYMRYYMIDVTILDNKE